MLARFVEKLTVRKLKRLLPEWTWTCFRDGFSWRYEGVCGDRTVEIRTAAAFTWFEYDDPVTIRWYVYEAGKAGELLWSWLGRQGRASEGGANDDRDNARGKLPDL